MSREGPRRLRSSTSDPALRQALEALGRQDRDPARIARVADKLAASLESTAPSQGAAGSSALFGPLSKILWIGALLGVGALTWWFGRTPAGAPAEATTLAAAQRPAPAQAAPTDGSAASAAAALRGDAPTAARSQPASAPASLAARPQPASAPGESEAVGARDERRRRGQGPAPSGPQRARRQATRSASAPRASDAVESAPVAAVSGERAASGGAAQSTPEPQSFRQPGGAERAEPADARHAEQSLMAAASEQAPDRSLMGPPAAPRASEPEPPAPVRVSASALAPAPAAPALRSEVELLRAARRAMPSQPQAALRTLDEHAARFANGLLEPEREVLAIEAMRSLGQRAQAERRLQQFRARFPDSIHLRRLQSED